MKISILPVTVFFSGLFGDFDRFDRTHVGIFLRSSFFLIDATLCTIAFGLVLSDISHTGTDSIGEIRRTLASRTCVLYSSPCSVELLVLLAQNGIFHNF